MVNKIHFGDCLELMEKISDESIHLILCDLPYGVTKNKWDCLIDLDMLWDQYERIIKPNGAIVLFGQDKFSANLMFSNPTIHRYNLIWEKTTPTGHLNAKKMPLRSHEDILVFYKKLPTYNPQKTSGHTRKVSMAAHKIGCVKTTNYGDHKLTSYDSTERYPKSVLKFATDKQKLAIHPTQKPLMLIEYLIKTFTNDGDVVLDNCSGSGTTAIASLLTKRKFICMENNEEYYRLSVERIEKLNLSNG